MEQIIFYRVKKPIPLTALYVSIYQSIIYTTRKHHTKIINILLEICFAEIYRRDIFKFFIYTRHIFHATESIKKRKESECFYLGIVTDIIPFRA